MAFDGGSSFPSSKSSVCSEVIKFPDAQLILK